MKLKGHSPVDLIINNRKLIEKIYIVLVIFSLICVPMVGINYDLTKYLPDSSPSAQALDIMEDEFTYPGMGRVMLEDVTLYEAKNIKDHIADVDGVDMVMWCDMATNIYGSSEFINYDNIDDYYKDNTAYMDVIFTDKDSSNQTHKAVHEIENIVGDKGLVAGSAVSDTNLGPTINKEVARVMALAVVIIYIILTITTTSWFEPVLFLSVLGIAILINMGTNIIFGEISFLSNAVGAVLQLACSMDYSIFLLHAFTQECATGAEPEQAMANAWRTAFSSIGASGMTTIVGFAAMALMNFGIGPDMGFVLAKGIALSLMTVLLLMPALILRSQNIIAKTQHRPFIPKQGRGIGEFAYKIRRIVFLVVLIIIIPCYIAQGMANFSYGNEAVANSPGTPVYEAEQQMNAKFGKSNMMIALVPPDSNITEKKMTEEIDDLSYVKYALSLSSVLPEGIPEDFLPENITSLMHSKNWARVIINVRSAGESDDAFKFSDNIRAIIDKYYPNETTYLVGVTPSTQDIKDIIVPDYNRVNIVSLLGVALVIAITYKALIAQGMANFSYGNEAVANSPGTPVYEAEQQMNAKFGKSNMMIALVPPDSNITEKKMTEEIDDLSYVKYALSLSSVLPEGIPEDFLPENITSLMHSKNWARVIINVRSAGESDDAFKFSDNIRAIIDKYYPNETTYLVGVTPSTQDIKDIIVPDYNRVNIVSLLGVALVIAITYKALILPIVVLIPIECAIFINTALPYIYGQRTMYLGFIIVGCIQLGATVDYSILMTGNYLDARSQGDKKEAAIRAVSVSAESVMTSGLIVMTVAYGLYFMTSVEAISGLGQLIGRGALISVILVLFFLPMCLMLFDRWIVKSDYAEKKHAKMNKIRATKIKLPILSELHQQRVNLQNQIRENRKARNKELRLKLKNLMNGDGFKLPQNYTPPTQEPSKQQQTEESAHKRMIGKKLRMRIHNRIEMRKEQLEQLAQRLGSDKNKPNDSQNDNQNDNTEENDHENR